MFNYTCLCGNRVLTTQISKNKIDYSCFCGRSQEITWDSDIDEYDLVTEFHKIQNEESIKCKVKKVEGHLLVFPWDEYTFNLNPYIARPTYIFGYELFYDPCDMTYHYAGHIIPSEELFLNGYEFVEVLLKYAKKHREELDEKS